MSKGILTQLSFVNFFFFLPKSCGQFVDVSWQKLMLCFLPLRTVLFCSVLFCLFSFLVGFYDFSQADFSLTYFLLFTYLLIPLWKALSVTFSLWMSHFLFLTAFALTLKKSFLHCFNFIILFTCLLSFFVISVVLFTLLFQEVCISL